MVDDLVKKDNQRLEKMSIKNQIPHRQYKTPGLIRIVLTNALALLLKFHLYLGLNKYILIYQKNWQ